MIRPQIPAWMARARECAARIPSPVGRSFAAARTGKTAEIYIYDAIGLDPWTETGIDPRDVVNAVAEAKGADELRIHINSPGGYVTDGIAIFNAIRSFNGKRTVYVDGVAASIASIIAMAGDRVVTNEGATWMIHDPMAGVFATGTAEQIEEDSRKVVSGLRKMRENMIDIYTRNTGQSVSDISAWMAAETWMTADESLARGFSDEVVKQPAAEAARITEPARAVALSPDAAADLACARVRAISERFPVPAAGTAVPCQPGKIRKEATSR